MQPTETTDLISVRAPARMRTSAPVSVRLDQWLRSERLSGWLLAIALALSAPSLGYGMQADDHLLLLNARTGAAPWALYSAEPADLVRARNLGALGWWSSTDLSIGFLRPLASLTHFVEFIAWPQAAWAMHLSNLVLYAVLLLIATKLYRQLLPDPGSAGLAALMFAIDAGHAQSVGWISGRNTVLVAIFVLAAVLEYISARRAQVPRFGGRSVVYFGLALLCGESGISTLAYLLAYGLVMETGPLRARLAPLWPHAAVALVWAISYGLLHCGTHGMTLYRGLDSPLQILGQGLLDLPLWLFSLFGLSVVSLCLVLPVSLMRSLAVVLALPVLALLWPVLRHSRLGRFLMLAMLLSIAPLLATMPQDRLLIAASFGASGVIACFFEFARSRSGTRERWGRCCFATLHLALAPLLFLQGLNGAGLIEKGVRIVLAQLPDMAGKELVVVNSPSELLNPYALSAAWNAGIALPASLHQLYSGSRQPVVTRVDARTLEMSVPGGWGGPPIEATVLHGGKGVPRAGAVIQVANMRVQVLSATTDGMPERVRFEFPNSLESPDRLWLSWRHGRLAGWAPPVRGTSVALEPVNPFTSFAF